MTGLGDLEPVAARRATRSSSTTWSSRLAAAAYTRVDLVEKRGEFAVRGGILDVFPPTEEHPLRVEFWGDTVEEIRWFKVADQRSLEVAEHGLWAPPCRELLLTDEVRERAARAARGAPRAGRHPRQARRGHRGRGHGVPGAGAGRRDGAADRPAAGRHARSCCATPSGCAPAPPTWSRTSQEFLEASWAAAAGGGEAPIDLGAAALPGLARSASTPASSGLPWWSITPVRASDRSWTRRSDGRAPTSASMRTAPRPYRGDTDRALADIRGWLAEDWRVVLVTEGHGPAERMVELLEGADSAGAARELDLDAPRAGVVHVATGCARARLRHPELRARGAHRDRPDRAARRPPRTCGGCPQPAPQRRRPAAAQGRRLRRARAARRRPLRRDGAAHRRRRHPRVPRHRVRRVKRGQPGDRLYVPTDQLDQVTRYVGGEAPRCTGSAARTGRRPRAGPARRSSEIAGELIRLYAARMAAPGHAFGADTPWQRELEDAFPYVETPDQLAAIDEVKADMEQPVPMDRLICGDVGYGKTEIAVRAAFKAVQDGKQVAVLVPTTLLVQQHFVDVLRALRAVPGDREGAVPVPDRQGGRGGAARRRRRHGRRRHRHPPAAARPATVQGPRAWSSSTRSSASASSTRST